jgi:hypothetical protein
VNTSRLRHLVVPLVAAAALTACGQGAAQPDRQDAAADDSSVETRVLTADGSTAGKCAMPNAETLSTFDTAFSGTVTSLADGAATLSVEEWYAGAEAPTVTVEAPSEDLQDLLMAVDFQEGRSYLVSATDDRVTLCGFTAEQSPELQALYDEAFAR